MAPEVRNHELQTAKLDIHSLGIVIYELWAGSVVLDKIESDPTLGFESSQQAIVRHIDQTEGNELGKEMINQMTSWRPEDRPSVKECLQRCYGQDYSSACINPSRVMKAVQAKPWKVVKPKANKSRVTERNKRIPKKQATSGAGRPS